MVGGLIRVMGGLAEFIIQLQLVRSTVMQVIPRYLVQLYLVYYPVVLLHM
eukprot:SAG11_NODE_13317_length_659_cov_1.222816_1_plen_50_part_00